MSGRQRECLTIVVVSLLFPACGGGDVAKPAAPSPAVQTLSVAAASDLKFALAEVGVAFAREQDETVKLQETIGASGSLFAQISNGAPFDIFLSADMAYPRKLIEAKLADPDSLFPYAIGHLVIWAPADSPLDVERLGIDAVVADSVRKVAIANPTHAPYGRAAEAALRKLGVYERVKDRLVLGENIAQTAQFVESGAADVGLISLSLALSPPMRDKGRLWRVPDDAHPPLEQGGVILSAATNPDAARKLRAF